MRGKIRKQRRRTPTSWPKLSAVETGSGGRVHPAEVSWKTACVGASQELAYATFPMATAVIRSGGKQYKVAEGDTVRVEKLSGAPGEKISFSEVLFIDGEAPRFGRPLVEGAKVEGEIVAQDRGKKLVVFKLQRRKKHRVKHGHRQDYTAVKITQISG